MLDFGDLGRLLMKGRPICGGEVEIEIWVCVHGPEPWHCGLAQRWFVSTVPK
jgi:hypothetical protein